MKIRSLSGVLLSMIFPLMLAACDSGGSPTTEAALSETIEVTDILGGELTVSYPDGWIARENSASQGTIEIGTNEAVLEVESGTYPADQTFGQVTFIPTGLLPAAGLNETATTREVLDYASQSFMDAIESTSLSIGETEEFTVNGRAAVSYDATITDSDGTIDATFVAVPEGDGFALLFFAAAPDDLAQFEDEIRAMAGALNYAPGASPALSATEEATAEATAESTEETMPDATAEGTEEATPEATPEATSAR